MAAVDEDALMEVTNKTKAKRKMNMSLLISLE